MKASINATTWAGHAKFTNTPYDWKQFIRDAKKAGYEGVELAGNESTLGKPAECRAFVAGEGLEIADFFANVTYNPYPPNTAQYQADMRYAAELGLKSVFICGGFMPSQRRNTYNADYDLFGKNLDAAIRFAGKLGLTASFHPHCGCIVETAAETRKLIRRIPDLKLCADIAHLAGAGDDPVAFLKTFASRVVSSHIKDYSKKSWSFVELGKGEANVAGCLQQMKKSGYTGWLTVELDKKWSADEPLRTPLESAIANRRFLKKHGV